MGVPRPLLAVLLPPPVTLVPPPPPRRRPRRRRKKRKRMTTWDSVSLTRFPQVFFCPLSKLSPASISYQELFIHLAKMYIAIESFYHLAIHCMMHITTTS